MREDDRGEDADKTYAQAILMTGRSSQCAVLTAPVFEPAFSTLCRCGFVSVKC